jgi:hypothetical protein
MIEKNIQDKIQKLELDTIRVVTELQKDVQNLTREVANLAEQVQKMAENYVTNSKHHEDLAEIRKDLLLVQRSGNVKSILVGVLVFIITALLSVEINRFINH